MSKGMEGKVALVTGGASGIGRVTAQVFAKKGTKVVVTTDANVKGAEETVRLIKDAGGEASFVKCDVSKEGDVESLIDRAVELYGSLNYAYNNAGSSGYSNSADATTPEQLPDGPSDLSAAPVTPVVEPEASIIPPAETPVPIVEPFVPIVETMAPTTPSAFASEMTSLPAAPSSPSS